MKKLRIVVHKGLDKDNKVQCHAVATCGSLIVFCGDFDVKTRYLQPSYWLGGFSWGTVRSLQEWKRFAKKGHDVVRFQRVTYIRDVD